MRRVEKEEVLSVQMINLGNVKIIYDFFVVAYFVS